MTPLLLIVWFIGLMLNYSLHCLELLVWGILDTALEQLELFESESDLLSGDLKKIKLAGS